MVRASLRPGPGTTDERLAQHPRGSDRHGADHPGQVVVVNGDVSDSVPLAEVLRSCEGMGQLWVPDRTDASATGLVADGGRSAPTLPAVDAAGVTLVVQGVGAIEGLTWARGNRSGLRAVVMIDPRIRPAARGELSECEPDRCAQDLVTRNAHWLSTSPVPKLLVSTSASRGLPDDPILDWAAGHVRNLTLEAVPASGGSHDLLGRVVRGWLGHISW